MLVAISTHSLCQTVVIPSPSPNLFVSSFRDTADQLEATCASLPRGSCSYMSKYSPMYEPHAEHETHQ